MHQPSSERPIGYWLKAADQAISAHVDEAQAANGVTRLEWQVLNTIREGKQRSPEQISTALHMFLDRATLDTLLARLKTRGWIAVGAGGEATLTEVGQRAYERILARQQEVRQQLMEGISAEDYATVLRVLKRIVANLGGRSGVGGAA
jgi:DNA-binding MarR family transcriptional regulator